MRLLPFPFANSRDEKSSASTAAAAAAAVAAGNFRSIGDKRRKPLWTLLSYLTLSWRPRYIVGYRAATLSPAIQKRPINARTWRATAVPRWEKFRSVHIVYAARYKGDAEIPRNPADCAARVRGPRAATSCAYMHVCIQHTRGPAARTPRRYHNPVTPNIDFDTYTWQGAGHRRAVNAYARCAHTCTRVRTRDWHGTYIRRENRFDARRI